MGRARQLRQRYCTEGRLIATELKTNRPDWQRPGPCAGCGRLVHGVTNGSNCNCAFLRARSLRLCRQCTIAYDMVTRGSSSIRGAPGTYTWQRFVEIYQRGQQAIEAARPKADT